ncbi:response regulator [Desulfovibrio subterraneus]|uniref:Response regulator n=1 Tax=Desulfovibrio subterraneus TaxID=2718620 RepID=A0A7J0BFI2_9BACT|nr:response regulator [Desulfovibrio subterraneus]GFM31924.1 response regulator [Desulfovibrio subterraneus]
MQSLRILIAEDDKLSATLIKVLLEAEGHVVCGVSSSGASAVEAARSMMPDAVLMDIFLSDEMSGVEAARVIVRELAIPILFITGTSDKALLEQVVESGGLGLIKKPVSADELRVNLSILQHHQAMSLSLREQAARYKSFFHDSPAGMYVADSQGSILECNSALARMLGFESSRQMHEAVTEADSLYEAADHRSMICSRMHSSSESRPYAVRLRRRDGAFLDALEFVQCTSGMHGGTGRYHSVLVQTRGLGDAAAAELQVLRSTIDAIPDMVVIMGRDRSVLAANKAFFRHVGSEDGAIDPHKFPFAGTGSHCSGDCPFTRFVADGKVHSGWIRFVPEGPEFYNTVTPLRSADGSLLGCVQVFRLVPPGR